MRTNELWAIDEGYLPVIANSAEKDGTGKKAKAGAKLVAACCGYSGEDAENGYFVVNGLAIISVIGVLSKFGCWYSDDASTFALKQQIQKAENDAAVKQIVVYLDSPGGMVSGTFDAAEALANCKKPTTAYISDCGASGAYLIASAAGKVYANASASVGSIGVMCVLWDYSQFLTAAGIKPILVSTAELKGAGMPGLPVSDRVKAEFQRLVDGTNTLFIDAVAAGRGKTPEEVKAWATGQVWLASDAMHMGLIDGVTSFESVIASLTTGQPIKATLPTPADDTTDTEDTPVSGASTSGTGDKQQVMTPAQGNSNMATETTPTTVTSTTTPAPAAPAPAAAAPAPAPRAEDTTNNDGNKCAKCGAALPDGAKFCPSCGTAVEAAPADDGNKDKNASTADVAKLQSENATLRAKLAGVDLASTKGGAGAPPAKAWYQRK